jgi:hypothetical protein
MEAMVAASKKKKASKKAKSKSKDKDVEVPQQHKPENIIICEMIIKQGRHWEISDGTKAEPGRWYKSKRGYLVYLEELVEDGSVKARSHTTGNIVDVPADQVLYFTLAEDPGTPCGTMLVNGEASGSAADVKVQDQYSHVYDKYPHVIEGSVYKVKNVTNTKNEPFVRGKKTQIKGQVRCKILCEICGAERDIKVQDAFQVKICLECKSKKRKKNLKEFLDKKKKDQK